MNSERSQELYLQGIDLFNREEFYDCHDALEEMWLEEFTPDRLFFQGLIQIAVGFYHFSNAKFGAGRSMFQKALAKLEPYPDGHRGINLEELRREVQEWKAVLDDAVTTKSIPPARPFPKIRYVADGDVGF